MRQLFRNLFHKLGYDYDYVFDWNTQKLVSMRMSSVNHTPYNKSDYDAVCTCTLSFIHHYKQEGGIEGERESESVVEGGMEGEKG